MECFRIYIIGIAFNINNIYFNAFIFYIINIFIFYIINNILLIVMIACNMYVKHLRVIFTDGKLYKYFYHYY